MSEASLHPVITRANAISAIDFRSDTVTSPTASMLAAMSTSPLGDDVYNEDETTINLERYVADLLGHEAGLFVASGTAGNQIALRVHLTQPPHSVLCHFRSHINQYEAGGVATLSQAMVQPVRPSSTPYLTLEDVQKEVVLGSDIHSAPTRVIALENTYGGTVAPLSEVRRISEFARSHGIKMHCDGARLWHAAIVAGGVGSLKEYGKEFDSVTVCFSKGIGAPVGSVMVGSKEFIDRARWVRKSIGGGMRQTGVIAGAARAALDEVFPDKLAKTHGVAKDIESHLHSLGLKTVLPVDTNMVFIDLEAAGLDNSWLVEAAKEVGLRLGYGGRIVVHHQISSGAVEKLKGVLSTVVKRHNEGAYKDQVQTNGHGYGSLKRT
ncbi:threonine aldolase [Ceratobasidium sp. AG-Ba]|nr:threonine aldolase [Ceratobasidium sp. AG-Ba]